MKKELMVMAVLAFLATASFAQTEKGKVVFSGASDLSFSSMKYQQEYDGEDMGDDSKMNTFNIKPSVSYFVIDNLSLGLALDFESQKVEDYKETSFMVGPMVRYYFGTSNIKPFIQGDVMFGSYKEDDDGWDSKKKLSAWDLGAGVAIFVNDFISVDLGLGYVSLTATDDEDDKSKVKASGVVFNGGFSIVF
ncbi:outer membrane beta-barrel protein [Carboxylicivirga taeanensis]|uniref:outer membrane beta-barrel protein n=1 Tax=Carboxylicivirga taeanensis TaxID=1416875 RepID=UPI003F6DD732